MQKLEIFKQKPESIHMLAAVVGGYTHVKKNNNFTKIYDFSPKIRGKSGNFPLKQESIHTCI